MYTVKLRMEGRSWPNFFVYTGTFYKVLKFKKKKQFDNTWRLFVFTLNVSTIIVFAFENNNNKKYFRTNLLLLEDIV